MCLLQANACENTCTLSGQVMGRISPENTSSESLMSSSCTPPSVWICSPLPINTHLCARLCSAFYKRETQSSGRLSDVCVKLSWFDIVCLVEIASVCVCWPLSSAACLFVDLASNFWVSLTASSLDLKKWEWLGTIKKDFVTVWRAACCCSSYMYSLFVYTVSNANNPSIEWGIKELIEAEWHWLESWQGEMRVFLYRIRCIVHGALNVLLIPLWTLLKQNMSWIAERSSVTVMTWPVVIDDSLAQLESCHFSPLLTLIWFKFRL